jgi:hypothetical protein
MNRKSFCAALVVFALLGATAALLIQIKSNRRLGEPGVKTRPLGAGKNLEVLLPAIAPGWTSENVIEADIVTNTLPRDTSFGQRLYTATDGFKTWINVVLMGTDRTSIHQPQICLPGQGWQIDNAASRIEIIHMQKPYAYDLPVMRIIANLNALDKNGQPVALRCNFIYWFVDAKGFTPDENDFKYQMMRDVLRTGILDRWAYVSVFAYGAPGQENAVFDRIKTLIQETVPEFQRVPRAEENSRPPD